MKTFYIVKIFSYFLFVSGKELCAEALKCEIPAPIAILINAETGKVLFEKNGSGVCHNASTTKVATLLYVLQKIKNPDQIVTASSDAVSYVTAQARREGGKHPSYRLEHGGTHAGIKIGEKLDVRTLLYGAMLCSGNDACNVLAETVSGSIPKFIEELNAFLRAIGCKHTHFTNPHGLPDSKHVTTAADLALMARFGMKNPLFREVVGATKYPRPETNKQGPYSFVQFNALLKPGKYYYPYATGIKTGFTNQAGFNLVSAAKKGDRELIAVTCNCKEKSEIYRTVVQLFETAFNEPKKSRVLLSKEGDLFRKEIEGAKSVLTAELEEDVTITFYPSEELEFRPEVNWIDPVLPIRAGDNVGFVAILDQFGNRQKTVALVSLKDIDTTFSYKFFAKVNAALECVRKARGYIGYFGAACLIAVPFLLLKRKRLKSRRNGLL